MVSTIATSANRRASNLKRALDFDCTCRMKISFVSHKFQTPSLPSLVKQHPPPSATLPEHATKRGNAFPPHHQPNDYHTLWQSLHGLPLILASSCTSAGYSSTHQHPPMMSPALHTRACQSHTFEASASSSKPYLTHFKLFFIRYQDYTTR